MTDQILKLFIKNDSDPQDPAVRAAVGRLAGTAGILCNIFLTIGKLIVGIGVGSMSIVSDGVNNLSDAASSVITLLGFRLAMRPADKDHPFGHARYEYISGLAIAGLILLIGAELIKSSVYKIIKPKAPEITVIVFGVLIVSVLVKLWLSVFFRSLGKKINSQTLKASAADSRNDVITTISVLAGAILNYAFGVDLDGVIGLGVAVFIFISGIKIARDTVSPLLGQQADKELVDSITQLITTHDKVLGFHDLLIHDYGPGQRYASVHVELSAKEDPLVSHGAIDDIERKVLEKTNVHLVVHYDPVPENDDAGSQDKS